MEAYEKARRGVEALSLEDQGRLYDWLQGELYGGVDRVEETPAAVEAEVKRKGVCLRQERVLSHSTGCHLCHLGVGHGPYWYAYWREGGRLRKRYLGKTLPADQANAR